ncbi:MAG: hypothetical protein AAF431_15085 [Pseudomonadota bacterium]
MTPEHIKKAQVQSDLLRETAVHEYVANQQTAEAREEFERMLESDAHLQLAVGEERTLRELLSNSHSDGLPEVGSDVVKMDNFAQLLDRIEAHEEPATTGSGIAVGAVGTFGSFDKLSDNAPTNSIAANSKQSPKIPQNLLNFNEATRKTNRKPTTGRRWTCWDYSVAASVASIALAASLLMNDQYLNEPRYTTLSSTPEEQTGQIDNQINFGALVAQQKVVRIVTTELLSAVETEQLLQKYRLRLISGNAITKSLVVSSTTAFSSEVLDQLRQEPSFKRADIVAFDQD